MRKFIVLDVEGYATCKPYNIGWLVGDKSGLTHRERSFAVMPAVWDNIVYKTEKQNVKGLQVAHEMTHRNIEEILCDDIGKYEKVYNSDSIFSALVEDITEFDIKRIWAYNCNFDRSAIDRLLNESQRTIINHTITWCDIIPAILHTRLLNRDYIEFCKSNNFLTDKGNIRTKAETVYKYLTNNLNFEERHTGLEDVKIEYEILLSAMKSTKNVKRKPCQAWKIIQQFCECEGIYIPALDEK